MDAGNVVEAYEALVALDGYKDSVDKANSIYYIGASNNPSMPATMSNKGTNIIRATTFNSSNVSGVYVPEGITEIE